MPGMGQPEWWLYAWTWLKYLPDCSLKRSWPLRTSLKVSTGPTAASAEAPSSMRRREPSEAKRGTPVAWVRGTKQLEFLGSVGSELRTTSASATLEVKFQSLALEEEAGAAAHTSSLMGWLYERRTCLVSPAATESTPVCWTCSIRYS